MAKAVSLLIGGNKQDVLAGTTLGVLPTDAPSYDVEISLFKDVNASTNCTLLMDGASVLENARLNSGDQLALNQDAINGFISCNNNAITADVAATFVPAGECSSTGTPGEGYKGNLQRGTRLVRRQSRVLGFNAEPKGDAPIAQFNAPAGAKLTLNLTGSITDDQVTSVYGQAFPNSGSFVATSQGHQMAFQQNTPISALDIFSGTPAGNAPRTASLWRLDIEAAQVLGYNFFADIYDQIRQDANITLLVDSDTIAEQFILPIRSETDYPSRERDLMISALVTGGSKITCNLFKPTDQMDNMQILMRAFLTPVAA